MTLLLSYCLTLLLSISHPFTPDNIQNSLSHALLIMKDYVHPNFKLQYPDNWTLDTSRQWGEELILFSPMEGGADKFNENVNVLIQDLAGQNIDLDACKQLTEQQITTLAADGHILESGIVTGDDGKYFRILYTMTQGDFKLKTTSLCYIHNDHAYLVTFSTEQDQYDKYKTEGEEILASFVLKK